MPNVARDGRRDRAIRKIDLEGAGRPWVGADVQRNVDLEELSVVSVVDVLRLREVRDFGSDVAGESALQLVRRREGVPDRAGVVGIHDL